ncbi:MAG: HAD hydrolase-like protein [Brevinematales bacterium]|jgi:phosphoglycolate phosphatase-like HAD superfamily hydrolase
MNAVLFDIDGTLLTSHGAGRYAFEKAILKLTGLSIDMEALDWFGRTDYDICASALEGAGYMGHISKIMPAIFRSFTGYFDEYISSHMDVVKTIQYVPDLLASLEVRGDICIGLLTGNVMETAFIKLKAAGLDKFFPYGIGGFGSDARSRNSLYKPAIERLKKYYLNPPSEAFDRVIIIGDSPKDIECARVNGVFSLAVATGRMNTEILSGYGPDAIIDNFKNIDNIIELLV